MALDSKDDLDIEELARVLQHKLDEISRYFIEGVHISLLVRVPQHKNADLFFSSDDPDLVIQAIQHLKRGIERGEAGEMVIKPMDS